MADHVDSTVHAVTAALRLADHACILVDANDCQQLTIHVGRRSEVAVLLQGQSVSLNETV